ncbi:MAG TPA: cytochrome P450 [Acidimicrobiia bacterium]|nr:cytochrome P450 [Acidimicrobiia bacterium]
MTDFDDIDFFRARPLYQDPYPFYEYLRAHGPVWREPHHDVVMITGYEEAVAVLNDTTSFSNCNAVSGPFARFPVPFEGDDISEIIEQYRDTLPFSDQLPTFDPPKHTAHRALLLRLITPKRLKENEEFMWRLADRQLDEFLARGECEFIGDYANPFTLLVIADLLGVPEDDHAMFRREMQGDPNERALGRKDGAVAHKPLEFLYERFTAYIEDRRREPRNDVMTQLATATFPDGTLPEVHDVMLIAANLFAAGQETTARMLGTALRLIGERPELQQLLRDEPDRIPAFVEECVRIESPIQGNFRLARRSTTVGGVDIPAGTTLMVLEGAANRDPRQFDAPAEFRLDRVNGRQHVGFGFGLHACVGAPLARAEGRVSIERILGRMAGIRISEADHGPAGARRYHYTPIYMLRGLDELHLEFDPIS